MTIMKNSKSNGCLISILLVVMLLLYAMAILSGCSRTNTSDGVKSEIGFEPNGLDNSDTVTVGIGTKTFIKSFVGADKAADYVDECYAKFGDRIINVSMASNGDYIRPNLLVIMVTVETNTYGKDTR